MRDLKQKIYLSAHLWKNLAWNLGKILEFYESKVYERQD